MRGKTFRYGRYRKDRDVTGGSQGIGAGTVKAFLDRDYNVVATSRNVSKDLPLSRKLALVDGDIGDATTAASVAKTAVDMFGSIEDSST
jgi:NAD(P)-dependent dehydrogenase (short-subunit alcohol dehydrogenase family)